MVPSDAAATPLLSGRAEGARRALRLWFFGPPPVSRLTATHCIHSAAETFFTISLAGSIFFSVSAEAARPRVLLFLVISLMPFLVLAPLVGPLIDRIRGGLAFAMVSTFALRAVLAVLLAANLRTLLMFPLAFGMLVVAKSYSVARNALVPSIVDDDRKLVETNSRLSRSATITSGVAAALAVPLYTSTSGAWTLRVAAAVYLVGLVSAWTVRGAARPIAAVEQDAYVELSQPDVTGAVWDMMALRAAIGFALFQFGFSLRAEAASAWVLGALILANGVGGFVGTVVSPAIRRVMNERSMFTACLVASAIMTSASAALFNYPMLVATIFVLGLSVSVGRRALDSTIQTQAPNARRGQVYATLEARLELVWAGAAALAVGLAVATWAGLLGLAGFLLAVAIIHLRQRSGLQVLRPLAKVPLGERLLLRAETLAGHHFYDEAVVIAMSAFDHVAGRPEDAPLSDRELDEIASGTATIEGDDAQRVIAAVRTQLGAAHGDG